MTLSLRKLRRRLKKESTVSLEHIYKLHKKYYKVKVEYELYEQILTRFFDLMIDELLDKQYVFDLPFNLGYLALMKIKTKANFDSKGEIKRHGTNYPIDNIKTKELRDKGVRKFVYDLDVDYIYKLKWFKGTFPNKTAYYLEPSKKIRTKQYYKSYEKC